MAFLATARRGFGRLGTWMLIAGLAFHYWALIERSRSSHTVPYDDLYGSLSLFAWLLAATYLGLQLFHRNRSVGAFVLPFVIAVFALAQGPPAASPTPASGPGALAGVAYHAECAGIRGVCSVVCAQRHLSGAKPSAAQPAPGKHGLALSGARNAGDNEPQQRHRGAGVAFGGDRFRSVVGESYLWPLLEWRPQGDHHARDSGRVCRLFVAGPHRVLARRARLCAVRIQLCLCAVQL